MKVLVTGATGFVGSAVARALLGGHYEVRVLARAESDTRNLDGIEVERVVGDLRDPASIARAVAGCSGVFHVAADYRLWAPKPEQLFQTNVEGTRTVLLAAAEAGAKRIVYTSSVAALGLAPGEQAADEDTPARAADMIGAYKQSKHQAQQEVLRLVAERGVPAVVVNPSTPVGPRDIKPTPTGEMILRAARGKMAAYVDTGLNVAHVADIGEGHRLAYERGALGECYILGGENMSLLDILREVAAITGGRKPRVRIPHAVVLPIAHIAEAWARFGGKPPFATVTGAKLARKKMYFAIDKAKRELGYDPRPARAALVDAIDWFRENGYLN